MKKIALGVMIVFLMVSLCGVAMAKGQTQHALEAPANLKLVIVPNGFKLSWKPSPEDPGVVTGYELVRSDLASGPFTKVATVKKGVFEHIDTMASREIIYYYKVRAVAGAVYSPYSNTVTGER
jgi:hypothetical protein